MKTSTKVVTLNTVDLETGRLKELCIRCPNGDLKSHLLLSVLRNHCVKSFPDGLFQDIVQDYSQLLASRHAKFEMIRGMMHDVYDRYASNNGEVVSMFQRLKRDIRASEGYNRPEDWLALLKNAAIDQRADVLLFLMESRRELKRELARVNDAYCRMSRQAE